jgi:hypothetical protein
LISVLHFIGALSDEISYKCNNFDKQLSRTIYFALFGAKGMYKYFFIVQVHKLNGFPACVRALDIIL